MVESPLAFTRSFMAVDARSGPTSRVHFSGPTLNTLDVLDMHRRSSELREGDLVAIGDAGAYAMSRATRYAGLPPAAVLIRTDGAVETIRRAETADDFTATMVRR
jgi:diaminopimelate decarboxylase